MSSCTRSKAARRCHSEISLKTAGYGWLIWTGFSFHLQTIVLRSLELESLAHLDQMIRSGLYQASLEHRRIHESAGKLLIFLASLTLSLCGHHLLHAYHGPRLKTTGKILYTACVVVWVYEYLYMHFYTCHCLFVKIIRSMTFTK